MLINPEFKHLFEFVDHDDKIEHNAQMISYRLLSEIAKACNDKGINNKQLAKLTGVSASYITQLFRGSSPVNMRFLAKCEMVLDMTFEFLLR